MAQRRAAIVAAQVTAGREVDSLAVAESSVRAAAQPETRLPWSRLPAAGDGQGSSTAFRSVKYSVQDGICIITRNRPKVLNAVNFQVQCDMIAAFEEAEKDDSVLVVVLTGAGRYFCSGADVAGNSEKYDIPDPPRVKEIKAVLAKQDRHDASTWSDVNMYDAWINFSKPLVIAANGPAIGEGFTTLMLGDIIYSSDSAFFWTPFGRFGVVPEITSSVELPKRIGMAQASEMILFSKRKTPDELMRAGLINDIIPAGDEFLPTVIERVRNSLELSGAPDVRLKALRLFKSMLKPQCWREEMMAQNRKEQALVRVRVADGDQRKNLKYYSASMPQKKK
mmetsp:Transcript_126816/g.224670  ORF Transcript_126816/g.224670 Transcript_126816/m.224670 type:complete len:337 (-) Transcript_126816:67-1077(-)